MKTPAFLILIHAIILFSGGLASSSAASIYTRGSGEWDGDIWTGDINAPGSPVEPGLRPGPSDMAYVYNTDTQVTVSTPVSVLGLKLLGDNASVTIADSGEFQAEKYQGQAKEGTGRFLVEGGTVKVHGDQFILSGLIDSDMGTGEFHQTGGTVEVLGQNGIELTRITGNTRATGIYHLAGGVLNIAEASESGSGISKGAGNGSFDWTGGTLNTASVSIGLVNNGSGNLSPGGDGMVGTTRLASTLPKVYEQGSQAKMTVDIASKGKFDQLVWKAEGKSEVKLAPGTTIEVKLLGNYQPGRGETFKVLSADKVIADGVKLGGPDARRFRLEVGKTTVSLVAQ